MDQRPEGLKMVRGFLWPEDDDACAAVIFDSCVDLDLAVSYCDDMRTAIQAGGNCGVWPAHLARTFQNVVTFEPDPLNFYCLRHNVPGHVRCFNAALGDRVARVDLARLPRNCGAHYVDGPGRISMVRLDDQAIFGSVDLISLDVEGYEMLALKGARNILETHHPVLILEDKGLSLKYGIKQGAVVDWLKEEFGYEVVERVNRDVILK